MDEDQNIPEGWSLDPKKPDEFPPLPPDPMPFATGKDQDAGQALESGQALAPPAPVIIGNAPDTRPAQRAAVPDTQSINYSGPPLGFIHPETATKPVDLPPAPERRDTVRGQFDSSVEYDLETVSPPDEYRWTQAYGRALGADKDNREQMLRMAESTAQTISMMTSQLAIQAAVIDDCRTRLLELERWAMRFTLPTTRSQNF